MAEYKLTIVIKADKKMKRCLILFFLIFTVAVYTVPTTINADERQNVYLYVARSLFEQGKYKEALENYERAAELGKIPTKDVALMAISYTKVKKYSKAEALLAKAIEEHPDNPLLLLAEGILNFDQKRYKKAYEYFSSAYKIDSTLIQAKKGMVSSLVNLGVSRYKTSKWDAYNYFVEALKLNPSFVPALQNLAVLEFEKGNTSKALEYINRALKYDPANRKVLELKYYIFYKNGDYKNQIKALLRLVVLFPKNPEYWAMLGKAYEETGQFKKSIDAFKYARLYDSSNPYPYYRLAEYYFNEKKNRTKALYILREGIGKAIYLIGQLRLTAVSELQSKKNKITESDIKKIEEMAKSIEKPKKILDDSLVLLRKLSGSDDRYKKELAHLIELYPHTVELQVALADLYTEKGKYKDAVKLWRYILIKHSRNIEAYKGISYCYMRMGDIDRAIKSYKIALDIDPGDKSIYEQLIKLYKSQNKIEALYKEWKERLYMDKRNPILLRELAKVEKMLGKNKDAEKHLKRADIVEKENREYEEKQKKEK